jgi:hypothetical protein
MSLTYVIGENNYDGISATVDADSLDVYVDGEFDQTIDIEVGRRQVAVVLDVTDYESGVHFVRFDLFLNGEQQSSDKIAIVV